MAKECTYSLPCESPEMALGDLTAIKMALDAHSIVATADLAGRITHANDRFCELSGYSRDELIGENHRILKSGCHPDAFYEELWKTISDGGIWQGEIKNRAKDGSHYWVATTIFPVKDARGRVSKYVSIRTDITERKRLADFLRTVIESYPGGITSYDANFDLRMANENFYRMYGLPNDLFPIGTPLEKIARFLAKKGYYGEGDVEELVTARIAKLKEYGPYSLERRCPEGRVLEVQGFPLREGGFGTTVHDATEKKQAQEKLRQSEQRLRDLAEVSSDWFWESDKDHRFTYFSQRFSQVTGVPTQDVLGKTRLEVGKDSDADWDRHLADLNAAREIKDFRYSVKHADGRRRYWSISGTPVFDADGIFQGYRGTGADKTAETEAQAELQSNRDELQQLNLRLANEQQRLDRIHRNTPVMLHSIQADGSIVDVSNFWCKKMGYAPEEVVGRKIYEFMDDASAEWMLRENAPKLFAGGALDNVHYIYVRKDGSPMDVRLSAITGPGPDGKTLQTFTVVVDVTDELRAKRELTEHRNHLQELIEAATEELKEKAAALEFALSKEKELNELQSKFIAMASHEFRTPLAIIDSSIQRLLRRKDEITPEDILKRTEKIRGAVARMSNLMESTLAAARTDAGVIKLDFDACDLHALVCEACDRQQELAARHKISCDLDELPETIRANGPAIEQVFTNLLSNAAKYSPDNPEIAVRGWRDGGDAVISVGDRGIGIDADDIPKMFARFFRAKTSTGIAGTGIGLDIAKMFIERHGGSISLESEKGIGSTFTVRLPIGGPPEGAESENRAA